MIRSNIAEAEEDSFKFSIQEMVNVLLQNGKFIYQRLEQKVVFKCLLCGPVAVLPTGFGKSTTKCRWNHREYF